MKDSNKTNQSNLNKYIFYGIVTGLFSSIVIGTTMYFALKAFPSSIQEMIIGCINLALAMLIAYSVFLISKPKSFTDVNGYKDSIKPSYLVLLLFITVFREILEITLFTLPTLICSLIPSLLGVFIGLALTVITGLVLYKGAYRVNINLIFIIITGILIYFGAELFGEALEILLPQFAQFILIVGTISYIVPITFIYIKRNMPLLRSLIRKDKM